MSNAMSTSQRVKQDMRRGVTGGLRRANFSMFPIFDT